MTQYDSAFSRPSSPPPLDLVQEFLNSVDLEDGTEHFATVNSFTGWVAAHVPEAGHRFNEQDRVRAIEFREALRDMVEHGTGSQAARVLQGELDELPLTLRIDTGGMPELAAGRGGLDAVLARVMASVHHAMIAGTWERLKVCRNDVCRWVFYDASKNHSGVWCSMATCGSKAKAKAYRSRMRKEAS